MPGVRGRSGGSNRISVAEHLRRGTYRPIRHAKLAALAGLQAPQGPLAKYRAPVVLPMPPPATDALPAHVLDGLGPRGTAFALACWRDYSGWTPTSTALLCEAAHLLDAIAALRGSRGERSAQREFRSMVAALRLED